MTRPANAIWKWKTSYTVFICIILSLRHLTIQTDPVLWGIKVDLPNHTSRKNEKEFLDWLANPENFFLVPAHKGQQIALRLPQIQGCCTSLVATSKRATNPVWQIFHSYLGGDEADVDRIPFKLSTFHVPLILPSKVGDRYNCRLVHWPFL